MVMLEAHNIYMGNSMDYIYCNKDYICHNKDSIYHNKDNICCNKDNLTIIYKEAQDLKQEVHEEEEEKQLKLLQ